MGALSLVGSVVCAVHILTSRLLGTGGSSATGMCVQASPDGFQWECVPCVGDDEVSDVDKLRHLKRRQEGLRAELVRTRHEVAALQERTRTVEEGFNAWYDFLDSVETGNDGPSEVCEQTRGDAWSGMVEDVGGDIATVVVLLLLFTLNLLLFIVVVAVGRAVVVLLLFILILLLFIVVVAIGRAVGECGRRWDTGAAATACDAANHADAVRAAHPV